MELKGSKTEKNLESAFAGESQARNKYTYFAEIAREEGLERIARAFQEAADNEKVHAKRQLEFLKGMGNTRANLKAAAEGEHSEWIEVYPEFERTAREEGFTEIADFFKRVAEIEKEHERNFRILLQNVEEGSVFKGKGEVRWKCRHCGWFQRDIAAPNECPTCKAPKGGFDPSYEAYIGHS